MSATNNEDYYRARLSESEIRLTDDIPEPEFGPVEVKSVYGNDDEMIVTILGIDGYSTSEIRTIIESAFERSTALRLLAENE